MFVWHSTKKTLFFSYCFCLFYETRKKKLLHANCHSFHCMYSHVTFPEEI